MGGLPGVLLMGEMFRSSSSSIESSSKSKSDGGSCASELRSRGVQGWCRDRAWVVRGSYVTLRPRYAPGPAGLVLGSQVAEAWRYPHRL